MKLFNRNTCCLTVKLNTPGNFSATLGFFGNCQLVEQLSMYRATFTLLRMKQLKIAQYKNIVCVGNIFVQSFSLGSTCFYERVSLRNGRLYSKATVWKLSK